MGAFRVCTANLVKTWTIFANPPLAAGYSTDAVRDGIIALLARSTAFGPATGAWVFHRGVGVAAADYVVAVVGLRSKALGVANVTNVRVYDSPDGVTVGASLGSITLNDRGDGWCAVHTTQDYLHIKFDHVASDQADIGEIFVATYTDLSRKPMAPLPREPEYSTIVHDAEDRSLYSSQQADFMEDVIYRWGALTTAHALEVATAFHAIRGRALEALVIPDASVSSDLLLGHLASDRLPRSFDAPVVTGLEVRLQTMAHYLYG
jgi:hypothetical protein